MEYKLLIILVTIFLAVPDSAHSNSRRKRDIAWNGNNWARSCDFRAKDMSNVKISGDKCGGTCAATNGCTHFTWTTWNGGTCWMKSGQVSPSDAVQTNDPNMVCGYMQSGGGGGSGIGPSYSGVLATRHGATEVGACQLPEGNYVSGIHPVALGNIDSLGGLKFNPGLCGHILRVDCGHGPVDIIVSNANLGGGLDLYASSWDLATGSQPPGQAWCTVQLTDRNPFTFSGPRCYYSPDSEKNNDYYHLLGVFNVGGRIVTSASLDGRQGSFNSITSYFAFNGGPVSSGASVTFNFKDGSTTSFPLGDCQKENGLHVWS